MIVREDGEHLLLVRQADHALLSGALAAAWGRPPWAVPEPYASTVIGARLHDLAWTGFDETVPRRADGRPLSFLEVRRAVSTRLYARGIDAVEALDEYAGLLTSLHFSGFFVSHWGWRHAPDLELQGEEREAVERFLAGEGARQRRLRHRLGIGPERERELMCNYLWLQLWDRISLDVCRRGFTGWGADYPATPVGLDPEAPRLSLHVELRPQGRCLLEPYPLLPDRLRASIPAARIPLEAAGEPGCLRSAWASGAATIEVVFGAL
ncbi:MAG TPA: DUF3891 family protein [Candidatus Dormibacteraeota bacterium]|nr:DUF3891 family protein [Candidatus Dormibacteraeota bacterium]